MNLGQTLASILPSFVTDHILTWMIFVPVIGMLACWAIPKRYGPKPIRYTALVFSAIPMILGIFLVLMFDPNKSADLRQLFSSGNPLHHLREAAQFVEHAVWIKSFNIEYFVGVDSVSVLMVFLTGLIGFIATWASFNIEKSVKGYFCMLLLLQTGMMGVFCAFDFFLFYVFWEVMLLPMYFLIGIWGGPRKEYAAIKFFLYTLAGSVLMLLAMIAIYYASSPINGSFLLADGSASSGGHTFNLLYLAYNNNFTTATILGFDFSKLMWVFLFIGFAIKIPMFPFHTWLPDAHVEAPTAVSVILAGVLLKMGIYGILRMNYPIFPEATMWAAPTMAVFGTINIVYGATVALAQKDMKKMIAYSSVSHMGFCLLGMSAMTTIGMNGAMMQMFNHGTITAMLFLLVGVIYDRAHHRNIEGFGGLAKLMPIYTFFIGLAFMAGLGLPGLSGFIGEALCFLGAFQVFKLLTIISVLGVILAAGYLLWTIHRMFLGPPNPKYEGIKDITRWEMAPLILLGVIVIILGFYPMPALDLINPGLGNLAQYVTDAGAAGGLVAGM